MIAWAGYEMFREGYISDFEMTQKGKWPLNELMNDEVGWKRIIPGDR
jgi:tRNA A37 threonylcarbamoyltransferase TsaD